MGSTEALLAALGSTHVGLCLCDADDTIRYVNDAFRKTFMPDYDGEPVDFADALASAITSGRGIRLETMPLPTFVARVRKRRREGAPRYDFSVDCHDGSWWWINDHRTPEGWTLVVASDMSAIKHEELKLRHAHAAALEAARTDFLTGVANRRCGFEQAELAIKAARAAGEPLTVGVIDIDFFKRINDTHGHEVGDQVLVYFAQALRQGLRASDQVSRIGGEEFMVVLPGTTVPVATGVLRRVLSGIPPLLVGPRGIVLPIAASAGVAALMPCTTFHEVLAGADAALYAAKLKGRDRVEACAA